MKKKQEKIEISGYDITGKLITAVLEEGESISSDRCPICNSLLVENYYDAPYHDVRCAICKSDAVGEDFNAKEAIKHLEDNLIYAKEHFDFLTNTINTLSEKNDVRKLNANFGK